MPYFMNFNDERQLLGLYDSNVQSTFPESAVEVSWEQYFKASQDSDGVWTLLDDGSIVKQPAPIAVPSSVTMMQARLAMLAAGLLDKAEAAIAGMQGDEGKAAQIQWGYAQYVRRDWPLIASLQKALQLNDKALDNLFIAAAAIR